MMSPNHEEPRYSSPTSPLPAEAADQLRMCIETANELLRTLSIRRDPNFFYRLMLRLRELRGRLVRVDVECQEEPHHLLGLLQDVGRDFIRLNQVGQSVFVPFPRLAKLTRETSAEQEAAHGMSGGGHHGAELADADPELRRNLVLNFGRVVSCSPELINLFLGIPLYLQLLHHVGNKVVVVTAGDEVKGVLCESEAGRIQVRTGEQVLEQVKLQEICYLKLLH
ncbi:hypothetical protein CBW65_14245 [Tumebacillus avium]|uniref:Uncharacterized protein n=1 Tax=Tumebacillus avium TaxID=1903704 RepID=A0A1Y0INF8_9BACL|nr:hypothetical protein [Tumebacillus avium]ARU62037.1 hypothetical protein CBW65_14245 [Tumebacillus avium]